MTTAGSSKKLPETTTLKLATTTTVSPGNDYSYGDEWPNMTSTQRSLDNNDTESTLSPLEPGTQLFY